MEKFYFFLMKVLGLLSNKRILDDRSKLWSFDKGFIKKETKSIECTTPISISIIISSLISSGTGCIGA